MKLEITVRDSDVELLNEVAEQQWREPYQQASAFVEQALAAARARKNQTPRLASRRGRSNGVVAAA